MADEGGILHGTFDRLVVLRDGSRAVGADVTDYKTDEVGDDPRAIDARGAIAPADGRLPPRGGETVPLDRGPRFRQVVVH